ncbi:MAG TPA: phospholipase A [Methylophilaceae bacterium]|nr:phospholipase A [Methylophilaceae bacterium]
MKNLVRVSILFLLHAVPLFSMAADSGWLIASQSESIKTGQAVELQVIRPSEKSIWPAVLHLRLIAANGSEARIPLAATADAPTDGLRRLYTGKLDAEMMGIIRAELVDVESNRLALVVSGSTVTLEPLTTSQPIMLPPKADMQEGEVTQQTVVLDGTELPALSVNEPMYFLLGGEGDARFQLSFNYRLFSPEGAIVKLVPFLKGMYFGYTQNSFWELGEDSKPFRDTSYRPSLFWQGKLEGRDWMPQTWKAGYEHESNGREDEDSRSIDTLFFEPKWQKSFADGNVLSFNPRIRVYLDKEENPDIQRYRGFVNWAAQYGRDDGWKFSANYLQGTAGYATAQIDASYPLGTEVFSNIGSFIHFQYFSGYGETLLNYNDRKSDQFRIGISIVR